MAHKQDTIYQTPPLAGRPPFATDDDSVYDNLPQQSPTRRIRQPAPPDYNARTSAYNVYDNYIDEKNPRDSGMGALGSNLMSSDMSDDDDDSDPFDDHNKAPSFDAPRTTIPLAAPKPGYAAPISGLKLALPTSPATSPSPSTMRRTPSPQQMAQIQVPRPLMLVNTLNNEPPGSPRSLSSSVPNSPHPLQPPMTPIQPAFVRPTAREVKFASSTPILRGNTEDMVLPKRGERGDDFWRRFSMVVKTESALPKAEKQSVWLRKTQNGDTRMSRWVWVVGLIILIVSLPSPSIPLSRTSLPPTLTPSSPSLQAVAGGIGIGVYISHNDTSHDAPTAIGGKANERPADESSTAVGSGTSTGSPKVTPTHTVARRAGGGFDVVPTGVPGVLAELSDFSWKGHVVRAVPPSRHRREELSSSSLRCLWDWCPSGTRFPSIRYFDATPFAPRPHRRRRSLYHLSTHPPPTAYA
ncbi:hypothetical protein EIP91_009089 [Steccherinum ochraceum]|uniref:Uncharacterized protein n=1 Tax=Steccherinum ochraceum TaxID=92696 RepID=A0A4R0RN03_9APHY|nr:hypothetical protein EIP91_009089 [Steccherinum ochraceum]